MSRVYLNAFFLLLILALSHVLVWQMDKKVYYARKEYRTEINNKKFPYLKAERLQIEKLQKKSLKKWSKENNGFIQMPINRAFDYYLRGLKQ